MQPSISWRVVYLFLPLKGRQSSILWSALCRFLWLYHCCHSLSLAVTRCHSLYYLLPLFVVTCCTTRCHSLSLVVPLVVTCHSLSLVVPLLVTCCHSLSLVVTRCATRLSFNKRSILRAWKKFNSFQRLPSLARLQVFLIFMYGYLKRIARDLILN